MEADGYWWPGFRQVANRKHSVDEATLDVLEKFSERLLQGCQFFKGPDAACKRVISGDTEKVRLMGKLRSLDKSLSGSTDRISETLGLNEIQAYCLLKQYAKSNEVDSKHLTSLTGHQLEEIQTLYMTERKALLGCILWAMQMRKKCECSTTSVGKKIRDKLNTMVAKGWGQNILKDLKSALTNYFEASPSGPATLGDAELDLLLEILTLYYETDPPESKEIVELVESLNKFGLGASPSTPWELCAKVWHLFMYALDFSAMLDCVSDDGSGNPHRLVSSLKEIDTEVQELLKCKDNISGVVMMAWALFIGTEKRGRAKKSTSKTGPEKRSRTTTEENPADPQVYFSAFGHEYIFQALTIILEIASELQITEKNVFEEQVAMTVAAVIIVAEKLLASREALDPTIKLLIEILERQGATSCKGGLVENILSNPRYSSIRYLFNCLQSWFPAIPSPYLKFLGALCGENMSDRVVTYFGLPSVTFEHHKADMQLRNLSGHKVDAALDLIDASHIQIKKGMHGQIVPSPIRLETKNLVKWPVQADIFHLMEGKLQRTMSREDIASVSNKDCQEAADMFRVLKRTMESPMWMTMLGNAAKQGGRDPQSLIMAWLSLALHGVEWFAEIGNVEALADCISILSSFTSILPSRVWNDLLQTKFLCPARDDIRGRHINSLLKGVWQNEHYVPVVRAFVKLTSSLIKEGVLGHHIKANAAMILDNVLLEGGVTSSINSNLTSDILNMMNVIVRTKWCRDDGFAQDVLSHVIHQRGVLQLLLDGTLPPPFWSTMDQQSENENCLLAEAHLNLMLTLLSQDSQTQKIVVETLLQPVKGGQMGRFMILLSYINMPVPETVPESIEPLVRNHLLAIRLWAKLLGLMPSKAILLQSLVPSSDGQEVDDALAEIRETVCNLFQKMHPKTSSPLFTSIVDLLIEAGRHHRPTYQMLLLPSKLQEKGTETSILDGLLGIVKDLKGLLESNPRVVFDCIRGIHCIWTYRREWPPPVSLMTVQQGFWQSLGHVLKDAAWVNEPGYKSLCAALVLEILTMESIDGWSGQSGAEAKKLWVTSGGDSQWSLLRNAFASCDLPPDPTVYLLSAANEVALDILVQMEAMDPDTQIPLGEKLNRVAAEQLMDMGVFGSWRTAMSTLRHSAGQDLHQRLGLVLLTELNSGMNIWTSSDDVLSISDLPRAAWGDVIPLSLFRNTRSMDVLIRLLGEARWISVSLRSRIAGLRALDGLARSHWMESSTSVSLSTKSASVASTSQAIMPWLSISKGTDGGLPPPRAFSGQVLPIQESDIKRQAIQIAQILATSLLFFVQEWCEGLTPPRSTSKSRTRSPTPRARSRSGSQARQDSRVEDLSHIGAINSVFQCVGAVLEGIEGSSMNLWIGAAKGTLGSILSSVAKVLLEYPFRSRGGQDGQKQLPGEVHETLGKATIAGLCCLVHREGEPVAEAIVVLGLLLDFDIWPDETLIMLRQRLDLQALLIKAMESIPEFAQKKGKDCPASHWSSAVLGFCHIIASRSFASSIFLLPEMLKTIVEYGKRLLDPDIGGLGTPDFAPDGNSVNQQDACQVDLRGAYDAETGTRRVEHRQWLLFLLVMESILTHGSRNPQVGRIPPNFTANLMAEFHCAMLKALEVPLASIVEPLTEAQLQETISALKFLSVGWKSCDPACLRALRKAVAQFADCCGSGNLSSASFCCPPVSSEEQESSQEKSPIGGGHHGWFNILAIGERAQGNNADAREEPAADNGGQSQRAQTPLLRGRSSIGVDAFQTPRHLVLHRRGSSQNMGRLDGGSQDLVKFSQHSFDLGHLMYMCLKLALEFLWTSTPCVSSREAGAVCPGLSKKSLLDLRQECLELGTNVSHWEMVDQRVAHLIGEVRDIICLTTRLLTLLGHTPRRNETERIETSLMDLERCLGDCRS